MLIPIRRVLAVLFVSCSLALKPLMAADPAPHPSASAPTVDDALAQHIVEEYVDRLPEICPDTVAFMLGHYSEAAKAHVPDGEMRRHRIEVCDKLLGAIARLNGKRIDPMDAARLDMVRNELERTKFDAEVLRRWAWDPNDIDYMFGAPIGTLLERDYAPVERRLVDISERLATARRFYAVIRGAVQVLTRMALGDAINQCDNDLEVIGIEVPKAAEGAKLDPIVKATLLERVVLARKEILSHKEWLLALKAKLDSTGGYRDFRLGRENYERQFEFVTQTGTSADALYRRGLAESNNLRVKMAEAARKVWPKVSGGRPMPVDARNLISSTLEAMAGRHGSAVEILPKCAADVDEARRWVEAHGLLTLPRGQFRVRDMPAELRDADPGVNACFVPGGTDPNASGDYFIQVPHGTPEANEPFLREATDAELMSISLHEMIPGHFAQFGHDGLSRVQKSINLPGSTEGWAVYAEQMMVETGFRVGDPEFLLMYYRDTLTVLSNFLLDYQTHALGMGEKEGMDLMVNKGFQRKSEAEGRWIRCESGYAQISSYYAGLVGLLELRERARKAWGNSYSLREFNDRVLACGPIPIRDMPRVVLPDPPRRKLRNDGEQPPSLTPPTVSSR